MDFIFGAAVGVVLGTLAADEFKALFGKVKRAFKKD